MSLSLRALVVCFLGTCCLLAAYEATPAADNKEPEKNAGPPKPAEGPQVVLYFNTKGTDTKDTIVPTGTRIRIRVEAGEYEYEYDAKTIAGETVGNVSEQVYQNMKAADWKVAYLPDRRGIIVYGCLPMKPNVAPLYKPVEKAGISYSTAAQPVEPGVTSGAKLLTLEKDKWGPKTEKK